MAFKFLDFVEQFFLWEPFLLIPTQLNWINRLNFYVAGKSDFQFPFSKSEVGHVFCHLYISFDSGVCLHFNNGNALNLERNHKSNSEK